MPEKKLASDRRRRGSKVPTKKSSEASVIEQSKPTTNSPTRFRLQTRSRTKKTRAEDVGYFRGAWRELRQVRWPDRSASWSLTFAVILFSLFFAAIILGLDFAFNELFRKVLL